MPLTAKPKKPAHHKKIQADHHHRNKHYVKAYWPYLPMLAIVGLGVALNLFLNSSSAVLGAKQDISTESLLSTTNTVRQSEHESALSIQPQLQAAAQAKANDLAKKNYWAHTSPDGATPWTFISDAGYQYQSAGENLAYGFDSALATIDGWVSSPEHRANLLSSNYQNVGFGIAQAPNFLGKGQQTIIVAEYGQPVAAAANITFSVPETTTNGVSTTNSAELPSKQVSRVQQWAGSSAEWSVIAITAVAAAAATLFVVRHGLQIHRLISKGEAFIAHHPVFDIGLVSLCVVAVTLTRVSGVIR